MVAVVVDVVETEIAVIAVVAPAPALLIVITDQGTVIST